MMGNDVNNPFPRRGGAVWVEFKGNRRQMFLNPMEFPFEPGDIAIVEAERGQDAGVVRRLLPPPLGSCGQGIQFAVIRRAGSADLDRIETLKKQECEAIETARTKVAKHRLEMDMVDAEYRFDGMKLTFYFTAECRVDFRELVRDLAAVFHTRIELRQIGARDEVKRSDGYGVCGRRLCCVSHLTGFSPITTLMAKSQNLILNPGKLSGVCGRLKCCLAYEYPFYSEVEHGAEPTIMLDAGEDLEKISD